MTGAVKTDRGTNNVRPLGPTAKRGLRVSPTRWTWRGGIFKTLPRSRRRRRAGDQPVTLNKTSGFTMVLISRTLPFGSLIKKVSCSNSLPLNRRYGGST